MVDLAQKLVETGGFLVTPPASARGYTKLLDDLKRLFAFEASNDPAQSTRQPADVLVEGNVFFSRGSRCWHCGKIPHSVTRTPAPATAANEGFVRIPASVLNRLN